VNHDIDKLMTDTLSGVESSLSCLLIVVESEDSSVSKILDAISPRLGNAYGTNIITMERIISIKGVYDAER